MGQLGQSAEQLPLVHGRLSMDLAEQPQAWEVQVAVAVPREQVRLLHGLQADKEQAAAMFRMRQEVVAEQIRLEVGARVPIMEQREVPPWRIQEEVVVEQAVEMELRLGQVVAQANMWNSTLVRRRLLPIPLEQAGLVAREVDIQVAQGRRALLLLRRCISSAF